MKKPTLLARLFGRSQHPVVTALHAQAFGQPLLVHPAMGEALIGAYLEGAIDAPPSVSEQAKSVAIINISGGLIHRPMPGLCDPGPMSYTAIRDAFDSALADDSVSAIVMRIQSPGGVVSGAFDLADHIHASRGAKPIIAVADDYAYSAAYLIAAACDEIVVSRTGGVGSVGVVGYHYDQSAYDERMGVKVTAVYAGDSKIDGSPHFPLSDSAKAEWQEEVDRLYSLFTESIAMYRSMDIEAVRGSQARTIHGDSAVSAGFADRMGTLESVLDELTAKENEEEMRAKAQAEAEHRRMAAKGALAAALSTSDLAADLQAALLKMDVEADQIPARIEQARTIADLCAAANLKSCAASYVANGVAVETVRAELLAAVADDPKTEISTTQPQHKAVKAEPSQTEKIYQQRRAAASRIG